MSSRKYESWLFGKWGPLERSVADWTKDVLWPEGAFCCACGRVTDGSGLCAACRESLLYDGSFWAWERSDPAPDLPAWSLRPHDGVPRQLILRLKYGAEARAARLLSELLLPLPEDVSLPLRKSWGCPAVPCSSVGTGTKSARPPSVRGSGPRIWRGLSGPGKGSRSRCSSSTTYAPQAPPSAAARTRSGQAARSRSSP